MGNIFKKCYSNKVLPIDVDLKNTYIDNNECPICLENIENNNFKTLNCRCAPKIKFHKNCINLWLASNNICPICRHKVEINIIRNLKIKDYPTDFFRECINIIFEALLQNVSEREIIFNMQEKIDRNLIIRTIEVINNYLNSDKFQSDIENENISLQINYSDIL